MWTSIVMLILGVFLFKMEFKSSLREYKEKGDKWELCEAIGVTIMLVAALIMFISGAIEII